MQVIRSEISGFCMGVSRALEMTLGAFETPGSAEDAGVYTMGPLIHNRRVLESLKERGIKTLKDGEMAPKNSTVLIRAHGIPPAQELSLRRGELRVLDATCPHVKKNQITAMGYAKRGYWVFLAGEKDHGEIIGLRSYTDTSLSSGPRCSVAANPAEAEAVAAELYKIGQGAEGKATRTVLIGQTTISPEEYEAIGESIKKYFPDIEILNTICGATAERQRALRELCEKADAVIIAGGRDSANTRRLLSLALELGKPAWIIESAEELSPEITAYEKVGLCSGASTPNDLIEEIEQSLYSRFGG